MPSYNLEQLLNPSTFNHNQTMNTVLQLSSDEFRIGLEKIRNSPENVEFEIRIRGQLWYLNSNSTKFDSRIWP